MKRLLIAVAALLFLVLPAQAANLLFQSDFGNTVHMSAPSIGGNSGTWGILGGDDGFNWPPSINGGGATCFQMIANSALAYVGTASPPYVSAGGSKMFVDEIISGARHDGTTGMMLHQGEYANFDGVRQNPCVVQPATDVTDEYHLIWMKFPSNMATQMGSGGWNTFAEWKTTHTNSTSENYDYRIAIYVYCCTSSGAPYWYMTGTEHSAGPYYWTQQNQTVAVPLGQWFKFEWAWHRTHDNTSWAKVWINGVLALDQEGGGTTCSGCDTVNGFYNSSAPINRIFFFQLYGSQPAVMEHWVDHVEIWDGVPSGSPPPPPPPPPPGPTITSNEYNVIAGAPVTACFSGITANAPDWIGFYPAACAVSGTTCKVEFVHPASGSTGACFPLTASNQAPNGAAGTGGTPAAVGSYNWRYYVGNTNPCCTLAAQSPTVTVVAPKLENLTDVLISSPQDGQALTFTSP